ncbi:MAG TPA: hypothetical protein VJI67_01565 [archaeon]|nr:hypothetical protein [archaeon]HLD80964.1 hypothetical protein [archaeon]
MVSGRKKTPRKEKRAGIPKKTKSKTRPAAAKRPVKAFKTVSQEAIQQLSTAERSRLVELMRQPMVRDYLTLSGGHDAIPLLEVMMEFENGEVDTVLANKLDMKVTVVRTLLNRLHYKGIVEYTRTKDEEIGWYTYKWNVRKNEIVGELASRVKEELEKQKEKLGVSENHLVFSCPARCHKVVFEIAAEYKFRCPDCTEEMTALDNEEETIEARKKVTELETQLERLQGITG